MNSVSHHTTKVFVVMVLPIRLSFPVPPISINLDCQPVVSVAIWVDNIVSIGKFFFPIFTYLDRQVYLDVDPTKVDDPLLLIVNTANQQEYNRKWSIRIRQIPCKSQYRGYTPLWVNLSPNHLFLAPPGCLQYYTALNGNVESFNYRTTNLPVTTSTTISPNIGIQPAIQVQIAANYLNNLNYGVCIARHPQMCAIRWQAIEFDFGGNLQGQSTPGDSCVGDTTLSNDNDYLVIPFGTDNTKSKYVERYCGQKLSSSPVASSIHTDVFCKSSL